MKYRILLAAFAAALAAPLAVQATPLEERPPAAPKAATDDHAGKTEAKQERRRAEHARKAELKQAVSQCRALRKQLGARAFAAAYPTALACVRERMEAERANRAEAKADCQAKLGKDAKARRIAKCAAKSAASDSAAERAAVVGAAKACAEELAADPAGFRAEYGQGRSLANAFGKCVAASVAGDEDAKEDEAAATDEHDEDVDDEDVEQDDEDVDAVEEDASDEDE